MDEPSRCLPRGVTWRGKLSPWRMYGQRTCRHKSAFCVVLIGRATFKGHLRVQISTVMAEGWRVRATVKGPLRGQIRLPQPGT